MKVAAPIASGTANRRGITVKLPINQSDQGNVITRTNGSGRSDCDRQLIEKNGVGLMSTRATREMLSHNFAS